MGKVKKTTKMASLIGDDIVMHEYKIVGDKVEWDGPAHQSWCDVANILGSDQCLAVILASKLNPFPLGDGNRVLGEASEAADYSLSTNGGRQLPLFDRGKPDSKLELAAHAVLTTADRQAAQMGVSRLAVLRYYLARRAHDGCNAPTDSYMRLAAGTLKGY